jgi:intracellular sulfur oxidation DsrE/DsrF family protein
MRTTTLALCLMFATGLAVAAPPAADAGPGMQFPRVEGAGGVVAIDGAALPDPSKTHRVLIDAIDDKTTEQGTNRHLDTAARALNLYALAGVPDAQVEVHIIVHGKATPIVLNDAAYRAAFGKPNPDAALIDALHKAGARISVCGQALAHRGHTPPQVHPRVEVALSAITRVIELQADGVQLLPW